MQDAAPTQTELRRSVAAALYKDLLRLLQHSYESVVLEWVGEGELLFVSWRGKGKVKSKERKDILRFVSERLYMIGL